METFSKTNIKLSYNDLKRDFKTPDKLTKDLAEEIGIHLGDGCLGIHKNGKKSYKYNYSIHGSYDDEAYLANFVAPLIYRLYNLKSRLQKLKYEKSVRLMYLSKGLINFKHGILGLKLGKKENIEIPKFILKSRFKLDCIRGLFDTDGCLSFKKRHKTIHYYPVIDIASKSSRLIKQVAKILKENSFTMYVEIDAPHERLGKITPCSRVFLSGKENLYKWMKLIGTSNPKCMKRFNLWKKYGYIPKKAPGGI